MNLTKKIALVTGANRGIGAALVEALLQEGAQKVYATARSTDSLGQLVALDPARVVPLRLDVTDVASVRELGRQAKDVDLLLNNAGILAFGSILDVPEETLRTQFETNFFGALAVARALVPHMQERNSGAIVNVLTLLSLVSMPSMAAYNASKAAAWSMTQSLRASLRGTAIKVHSVFPGAVDTEMLAGVEIEKTSPGDVARAILAGVAAETEDIFPDPMSTAVYSSWKGDHKAVEKQFASM
jgi:NAD(P)-dependent dehydrogenase (short-subunit alcohol dehydrogenase family)